MQANSLIAVLATGMLALLGCGKDSAPVPPEGSNPSPPVAVAPLPVEAPVMPAPAALPAPVSSPAEDTPLPTISLGGSSKTTTVPSLRAKGESTPPVTNATTANAKEQRRQIVSAMDAIQIVLGSWRGTTNKEVGEFKAVEAPSWVWDFRSERGQPALVMSSEKSQYITQARLTYLTDRQVYRMIATDKDGQTRTLEGEFTAPVEEFEGDDRRVHRRFKLQLTEVGDAKDALQLTLNQQDNNRYLFEVERKRGQRFVRVDTVGTQRDGSSFALNDTDYKDRTCVISGGLGTSQVSFNGKSYWVCCSGCKAAFDEEPARWVAEFEAKQKEKAQPQPGT